ncbi:MAG: AMP-binding protein, partial [archaeon]|nr:AMP-binding protein [archaeon]
MKKFDNNREEWFQDPPYNLVEIFENGAKKFKDLPSLGIKNESGTYEWITHGEIANRVDNLRGGLAQIGINKDDVVGIIKNNSVEFPVIAQATYGRSGWFIPMYEQELLSVWKYIIKDSKMKIVFVANNEIYNKLNDSIDELPSLEKIIVIDGESEHTMAGLEELGKANPVESRKPNKDDIAGLIYTSGTTGDPKGVLISHGNYASMIKIVRD